MQIFAQNNGSRTLTFSQKQLPVSALVSQLKSLGYKVSFDADISMDRVITLTSTSVTFDNLALVLQRSGIGIKNIDGNLVIKKLGVITVSGTVTSGDDNLPLQGVTITDDAKRYLGSTNINGKFSIQIAAGTNVNFTMLGYAAQQSVYQNSLSNVSIVLNPSNTALNEVVVTALGIKREEKALGYSVTTVKGEQLTDALSSNWTDALSGKVAGLNLVRSNGGPIGTNKIILRGENNLTGENEALIVVDGVVINNGSGRRSGIDGETVYATGGQFAPADYGSSINDINPEDIESVTVLKGPAAAALYGGRAANGAVIITTKSGNSKKKGVGVTFNSNASIEQINRWPDLQFEYGQGTANSNFYSYSASADGGNTGSTSSAYGPRFAGQMFYQYDPTTQAQGAVRTPWVAYPNKIRDFFNTGNTLTNSISIDGGSDKTTARFAATNVDNHWITPNTGYNRKTVSMSVNSKMSDKLTIQSKINYQNRSSDNLPGAGYGNQSLMYWFIFWEPNADLDWLKNYWQLGNTGRKIEYPFSSFPENPYAVSYEFINKSNRNAITGNVQGTYNITKGLSLMVRTSLDLGVEHREQQRPYDTYQLPKGAFRFQDINSQEVTSDFLLRYTKKISDFNLTITGGGSTLNNTYRVNELRADSLVVPEVYTMANRAGAIITRPYTAKYTVNSFYGLFSAGYKDYLYLDLTGRQDWNSGLATPERTDKVAFFYPSASLSFIASEVFKLPKAVSYAKLRLSAAQAGSGGTTPYRTTYTYQPSDTYPGGLSNPTLTANPNLQPLLTSAYEVGTDVRLFNNRLSFDFTLYTGSTSNQQLNRITDASSGTRNAVFNLGKVNNKGIEIALGGTPIQTKKFKWMLNYTFSANRNKIVELGDTSVVLQNAPTSSSNGGSVTAKVGGSMGDLYGFGFLRSPDGQVVYDSKTGIPIVNPVVKYLGNIQPKWKMSISQDFTYSQFHLHVLFDAQYGAVASSLTGMRLADLGKSTNTLPGRYNGLIGEGVVQNPDGTYRKNDVIATDIDQYYQHAYGALNAEGSTYSTNFLKFREATLDYTVPVRFSSRVGIQRATIGVYGRDLFIWTKWPGFDPEFGTLNGSDVTQGFEVAQFPSARTLGVKLLITL